MGGPATTAITATRTQTVHCLLSAIATRYAALVIPLAQLALGLAGASATAVTVAGGFTMDILATIARIATAIVIAKCPTRIAACQTMFATTVMSHVPHAAVVAQAAVQAATQALFSKVGCGASMHIC